MYHTWTRCLRGLLFSTALLVLLSACASTAAAPKTQSERIAQYLSSKGAELTNVRPVSLPSSRSKNIVENYGFDIPGITIGDGKPAGTIRIYKGEREADAERRVYGLLGKPGPETKLDYVTVSGTRGLILDHRLPQDVAQRYIDAFSSSP
jgi:hypothetical protein